MKKLKALKTLLIPSIAGTILGTIATISTSCATDQKQNKEKTFVLEGGNLELNSIYGKEGKDSNSWDLLVDGNKIEPEKVSWTIENNPSELITIDNGCISWKDSIPSGTYNLLIKGSYLKAVAFETVNLVVQPVYKFMFDNKSNIEKLWGFYGSEGQYEETLTLIKDDKQVDNSLIQWEIITEETLEDVFEVKDSKITWNNKLPWRKFKIQIKAKFGDEEAISENIDFQGVSRLYFF